MNPKRTLETAAYNYVAGLETPLTLILSTSIYKGIENQIDVESDENTTEAARKVHPSLTLTAEGAHEELVFDTGVIQGILAVTVEANGSRTTDAQFAAICNEAFGKFNIVELETNFSSRTTSFRLINARVVDFGDTINNGQNWQRTLRLECTYAEADL